nr:pyridoxal phosphate-dependent aminotransferase [Actinoplanes awajinensis]WKD80518.1 isopropylmalate isomerase small subunit [Actinoplanes awajinensis subsp. mycoplanecinus]
MELLILARLHGAIDLATGTPAFPETSEQALEAAITALRGGFNQYSNSAGTAELRAQAARLHEADPETEITITAGATEGLNTVLTALVQPGDEVVVLDPYYESFSAAVAVAGGATRFLKLHPPEWKWREDELREVFGPRTRAVILNSPHNPTGRMFSVEELQQVTDLCATWNVTLISDEVYAAYAVRDGRRALPSEVAKDVTVATLRSMSKSHSISGWRIGWIHAEPALTRRFRLVHETLTACVATPLQLAAAADLRRESGISVSHLQILERNQLRLSKQLHAMGMAHQSAESRCYLYARLPDSQASDAIDISRSMIEGAGVATAPGPFFHSEPSEGRRYIRFSLNKSEDMITEAIARISAFI